MKIPVPRSLSVAPSTQPLRGPEYAPGPEAFGAQVGASLQNLAASTMALGQYVKQQEDQKAKFSALQSFSNFQNEQERLFMESQRTNPPGNPDFYKTTQQNYTKAEAQFLAQLPQELQQEFKLRTTEFGGNLGSQALKFQYESNDTYFKQGLQSSFDNAKVSLSQDGSLDNLETQRAMLAEQIVASGLSEAEKVQLTNKAYAGLEQVAYKAAQIQRLRDEQSGLRTDLTDAVDQLDTEGMTDTQAQAAALRGRDIAIGSFGAQAQDVWSVLPLRVRSALIATAAQEGSLPGSVVAAVTNGDMEELVSALKDAGYEKQAGSIINPSTAIDSNEAFSNVAYEDRLTLTNDAEREVAAELTDQAQAQKAQNTSVVNALKVALYDGTAGQADIDALREKGVLTDYEDIKSAQDILAKRDEDLRLRQLGQKFLDGSATYAPGNEEHKKVLDAMVGDDGLAALDSMDSEYAATSFIPLVRQTGAVPDKAKELISGMMRSTDPDKMTWALDLMSQIERAAPKGYLQFTENDRQDVDLWAIRKDYVPQEELLKQVRGPVEIAERNSQLAARKEGLKLFTDENGIMRNYKPQDAFKYGFLNLGNASLPGTKWAADQFQSDFQALFIDSYSKNGDVEASKKAALAEMTRVWGVTNVGADGKLMKFPPEKIYPSVAEGYDWLENQLRTEGALQPDEQFELLTDRQTENEVNSGIPPSYLLVKHKPDGTTAIDFEPNGLPKRVFFEFGPEQEADENAWKERRMELMQQQDAQRVVSDGLQKALDEGTTVPDELFNEYVNSGLLQQMMQTDPQATGNAQAWDDAVKGTGGGGIATGQYRLP